MCCWARNPASAQAAATTWQADWMVYVRHVHRHVDVTCDLGGAESLSRITEWRSLQDRSGLGTEPLAGGTRLWLSADAAPLVYRLVAQEAQCCGFLDFEVATEGDRVRLDITSPVPEGAQVAALLVGRDPDDPKACC